VLSQRDHAQGVLHILQLPVVIWLQGDGNTFPKKGDTVSVRYKGTLTVRLAPATFGLF
jgi:FKBP-type peptidyl-prolyl cis-trans isomerase